MSIYDTNDIAQWEDKQMTDKQFQVEEIETINFDENGKENGTWNGYAVTKIDDPANYCFECRDEINADKLCEFLNNECYININDTSIEEFVIDNCIEWKNLITELSYKDIELYKLKKDYQIKSDNVLEDARKHLDETGEDIIKAAYGGNNDKTRKQFVKDTMVADAKKLKDLEFSIDYLKRRISYLKSLVNAKTSIAGVKNE